MEKEKDRIDWAIGQIPIVISFGVGYLVAGLLFGFRFK